MAGLVEALPEETGSQRIGPTYRHAARTRLYCYQAIRGGEQGGHKASS